MIGGALAMAGAALYDPALLLTPAYGNIMTSLMLGGISMEAGALAQALTSNRGTNVTIMQPASMRQIIYGTQRVGGVEVYISTTGSHHDQYNRIIVLAGHVVDCIENLYLDGRQVFWAGTGPGYTSRGGVNFGGDADGNDHIGPGGPIYNFGTLVYCEARYGDQLNGDVISGMTANDPTWAADGLGNSPWLGGCTYVYLKIEYDTAMFPSGPGGVRVQFTVRGKNDIYDPRTGSKGYTDNWALIVADVLTDTKFGLGDVGSVNTAQLIAAANVCDEQVALRIGGTENRYCCHWHYDTAVTPGDVLSSMMPAAAGRLSRIGGEWYIWPAYWQGASFAFDESVLTGSLVWNPYRGLRELSNRVTGVYTAPASPYNVAGNLYDSNGWYYGQLQNKYPFAFQPTNYPMYACDVLHGYAADAFLNEDSGVLGVWSNTTTYEQGDAVTDSTGVIYQSLGAGNLNNIPSSSSTYWMPWNNALPMEVAQLCCLSIAQAQRCAKILLLRNRQQGSGAMKMHLTAWQMQPLTVFTMTFPANGWTNKLLEVVSTSFRVEQQNGVPAVLFEVQVQETDSSIYNWSTTEELSPYDVSSAPAQLPFIPAPPTGMTLSSGTGIDVIAHDGTVTPRILVQWLTPYDAHVIQIGVQYQKVGDTFWTYVGAVSVSVTMAYITGVVAGQAYNVQINSQRPSGPVSPWVTVSNYTVATTASFLGTLAGEIPTIQAGSQVAGTAPGEMLVNGNFENGATGWALGGSSVVTPPAGGNQTLSGCLQSINTTATQTVGGLLANRTYLLQMLVKTSGSAVATGVLGAGAIATISAGTATILSSTADTTGSDATHVYLYLPVIVAYGWALMQATFSTSSNCSVSLALQGNVGGGTSPSTVWFDNVSLTDITGQSAQLFGSPAYLITPIITLMPRQAGADVTASNTAADTTNVNGVASHLISPISTLMPAQAGADKTASNTAAGIAGQGALATLNQTNTPQIVPGAVNASLTFSNSAISYSGSLTQLASFSVVGTPLIVAIRVCLQVSTVANDFLSFNLYRGTSSGTLLRSTVTTPFSNGGWSLPFTVDAIDLSPAVNQTYTLMLYGNTASSGVVGFYFILDSRKA